MESVNKKVILIALIMAVLSTFLVYVYIRNATTKPEARRYVYVYVASDTLPPKHKISEKDIKQVKVTPEYVNSNAIQNKADIIGKSLKDRIIEGEQILRDRLVEENNLLMAFNIPEGKRAVSIDVTEQTEVANHIRPGDFVDVIATFQKEEMDDKEKKYIILGVTSTVIQNAQILALGQEQVVGEEKMKELPKTVTLAVTPQEAEKLVFSSEFGTIRLALRPAGDDKITNSPGVIRNDVTPARGVTILSK